MAFQFIPTIDYIGQIKNSMTGITIDTNRITRIARPHESEIQ